MKLPNVTYDGSSSSTCCLWLLAGSDAVLDTGREKYLGATPYVPPMYIVYILYTLLYMYPGELVSPSFHGR